MKKIAILFCAAFALLLGSCEKEDALNVAPIESKYNLEDDPNDPVQHFIHETYRDYGIVVITNPTEEDYKYNFTNQNLLELVPPAQTPEVLQAGVEFLKRNFLDLYSTEFKKQYMPFTLILAESVINRAHGGSDYVDTYSSKGMLIISNVDENMGALPAETEKQYRASVNAAFWSSFMGGVRQLFTVPDEFYTVSGGESGDEGAYRRYNSSSKYTMEIDWDTFETIFVPNPDYVELPDASFWYKEGFVNLKPVVTEDPDYPYYDGWEIQFPQPSEDLPLWVEFIFSHTDAEIEELCRTCEKVQQKYVIVKKALEDAGCDLGLITQ